MSLFSKISGAFEPLREKFGGWWDERNPRERIILKVAVPLCLIFLIYSRIILSVDIFSLREI